MADTPYATADDLTGHLETAEIVRLSNDTAGATVVNAPVVASAIAYATARVNEALAQGGYVVPVVVPTEYLKGLTVLLAIKALYARKAGAKEPDLLKAEWARVQNEMDAIGSRKRAVRDLPRLSGGVAVTSQPDRRWPSSGGV